MSDDMPGTHGGTRPSAGRPRGSKNKRGSKALEAQMAFAELVLPHLEDYFNELHSQALNAATTKERRDAISMLLDRGLGRAIEIIEMTNTDDKPTAADLMQYWEEEAPHYIVEKS